MMYKKILITGGAGFIGSALTKRLLKDTEANILIYDNLHSQVHGVNAHFQCESDRVVFVKGCITDVSLLSTTIEEFKPDCCFHMAAETGTGQSQDEIARYTAVNVQGTSVLLEALNRLACFQQLYLPSSRAVYGEGAYRNAKGVVVAGKARSTKNMQDGIFDVLDQDGSVMTPFETPEDLPLVPASIYASTKLMQEYLCDQARGSKDWSVLIYRFQNVYGPGQSLKNPYTGVLSIFATQIIDGKELNIFEDGKITRDFIYIDDLIDALILALDKKIDHGEVVNIGSGQETLIKDAAEVMLQLLGKPKDHYHVTGEFREGDIKYALANIEKAKKLLSWTPSTTINRGLDNLVQSILD